LRRMVAHRLHPTHRKAHRKGLKSMRISFESDSKRLSNLKFLAAQYMGLMPQRVASDARTRRGKSRPAV
ncbi:MAG: hypothetical protein Q8K28_06840, partial [Hoeflea sp.]|uniref:hypothetical protein n=1 Tax=Hoeflea sp. TaxID=1940281 RepID=UPI00272F7358